MNNFRDRYYNRLGQDIATLGQVWFASAIGNPGGTGTRENPFKIPGIYYLNRPYLYAACGAGVYIGNWQDGNEGDRWYFFGEGIGKTIFKGVTVVSAYNTGIVYECKDMTLDGFAVPDFNGYITGCEILQPLVKTKAGTMAITAANCLVRFEGYAGTNNSYVGVVGKVINNTQLNLLDACDVVITASDINNYKNNYLAFNNCRLKIGGETGYSALAGDTEDLLRQNFVDRCAAQGITVPNVPDLTFNLPMGRWVFSNSSCVDGVVIAGSTIHNFEKDRYIYFGYTDVRGSLIPITADSTTAGSFNPAGANASVIVTDNSIGFSESVDISQANTGIADSNIIRLGGKRQLSNMRLSHNFPAQYGVLVDSTPTLGSIPVAVIEAGKSYYVRSSDQDMATVTYNGTSYNSALSNRNNIFAGADNQTAFTGSANAVVYEILDKVMRPTVQMRIVNKIPADLITTGNLQAGYWYLVEPDSPSDTTGTVTYNGVTYPAYSSFLVVSGTLGFSITGATHLRRCWRQDYDNPADEITDVIFWQNEQKPKWFDADLADLRCVMKDNNGLSAEMQADGDGNYIASGHPDFVDRLLGTNSVLSPAYPIKGAYMQLRVVITTLNPAFI